MPWSGLPLEVTMSPSTGGHLTIRVTPPALIAGSLRGGSSEPLPFHWYVAHAGRASKGLTALDGGVETTELPRAAS